MSKVYLRHYPDLDYPRWSSITTVEGEFPDNLKIGDGVVVMQPRLNCYPNPKNVMTKVVSFHNNGYIVEAVERYEKIDLIIRDAD
jgi:hypothetical protein